jgi:uncharacterized protein YjeT (DUF2065 family)
VSLFAIDWALILKGLVRFVATQLSLRVHQRVTPEQAWQFRVRGIAALALGSYLRYLALFQ